MHVDDLDSQMSCFTPTPPNFPGSQVHIVMWERQGEPFQNPPVIQRLSGGPVPLPQGVQYKPVPSFLSVDLTRSPVGLGQKLNVNHISNVNVSVSGQVPVLNTIAHTSGFVSVPKILPGVQPILTGKHLTVNKGKNANVDEDLKRVTNRVPKSKEDKSENDLPKGTNKKSEEFEKEANEKEKKKKELNKKGTNKESRAKTERELRLERIAQNVAKINSNGNLKKTVIRTAQNTRNIYPYSIKPVDNHSNVVRNVDNSFKSSVSQTSSLCSSPGSASPPLTKFISTSDKVEKAAKKPLNYDSYPYKTTRKWTASNFEGYVSMKKRKSEQVDESPVKRKRSHTAPDIKSNTLSSGRGVKFGAVTKSSEESVQDLKNTENSSHNYKLKKVPLRSALKSPVKGTAASRSELMKNGTQPHVEVKLDPSVSVDTLLKTLYSRLQLKPGTEAVIVGEDGEKKLTIHSPKHIKQSKIMVKDNLYTSIKPSKPTPSSNKCVQLELNKTNQKTLSGTSPQNNKKNAVCKEQMPSITLTCDSPVKKDAKFNDSSVPDLDKLFSGDLNIPEPDDDFLQELFGGDPKHSQEIHFPSDGGTDMDIDFDTLELGFNV